MPRLDSKEIYLYGMMFSLVNDTLKLFEKCRHKKPSMWDKARGASRELKIEKILREILKRKLDKNPNDQERGKLLIDDLSYIVEDNNVWHGVNNEHADYVKKVAMRFT